MKGYEDELRRSREAYATRDRSSDFSPLYDPLVAAAMFRLQEREWVFADLLRRAGIRSLGGLDLLEVGCGSGASLVRFIGLGAAPDRLAGIDLMPDRIDAARRLLPQADLRCGSAHELPYPNGRFDIVAQLTLFSSVVDPALQDAIAAEMLRVVRPGGAILWYDADRSRSRPDFVPIPPRRLATLFPGCEIAQRPVTLRWGLIYRLVPLSRFASLIAQSIPICCSHRAAIIRPSGPPPQEPAA